MEDAPTPIAELEHGPSKFEEFLDKHQKKLIIIAALVFIGVLAYILITGLQKKNTEEGGAAFMEASTEKQYRSIISDYGNSPLAGSAAMEIAKLRTTSEDQIKALDHFVTSYPDHPGVPYELLKLALIQMNVGKNTDAKNTLDKLISTESAAYLAPRAKIALADIAYTEGDKENAEKIYQKVKNTNSPFSLVASERLLHLNAVEPVVLEPKPESLPPAPEENQDPLSPEQPTENPEIKSDSPAIPTPPTTEKSENPSEESE